ncbi:acyltransferase [Halopseudomonas sp.]|uniref:acyltransferase family protein n=1 Tax=Halopseudomonas sp. TaxID=2901191 RepID=UPI00311DC635
MTYQPHLDGLRALAVLAVVAFHARAPGFLGGYVGVDLFFVLSGYLITNVLRENSDLKQFYIRRARRLIPPLALMLIAYITIFPIIRPGLPHFRDAAIAFTYLSDYAVAFWNEPDYLRHTWSLAVEEHFYLLWPLVFLRFRPSIKALLIAYIVATAWRWGWPGWHEAYSRFDTRLSGLILGCLLAGITIQQRFPAWPGLLVIGAATATYGWGEPWVQGWGFFIVEIAAAVAILGTPPAWLSHPQLVYLGKLSYGVYLWHYPITKLLRDGGATWEVILPVSLSASVLLAAASFQWLEVYFRSAPSPIRSADQARP